MLDLINSNQPFILQFYGAPFWKRFVHDVLLPPIFVGISQFFNETSIAQTLYIVASLKITAL